MEVLLEIATLRILHALNDLHALYQKFESRFPVYIAFVFYCRFLFCHIKVGWYSGWTYWGSLTHHKSRTCCCSCNTTEYTILSWVEVSMCFSQYWCNSTMFWKKYSRFCSFIHYPNVESSWCGVTFKPNLGLSSSRIIEFLHPLVLIYNANSTSCSLITFEVDFRHSFMSQ